MNKHHQQKKNIKYFSKDNVSMAYWVFGEGDTILIIHGGGTNVLGILSLIKELSKSHRIIAVDLPGHGYSSCPKDIWGLDNYAEFLLAFIHEMGVQKLNVVAHSLGGGVAIALGQKVDFVEEVIAINSIGIKSGQIFEIRLFRLFVLDPLVGVFKYKMYEIYWNYFIVFLKNLWWQKWNLFKSYRILKRCVKGGLDSSRAGSKVKILWGREDRIFSNSYANKLNSFLDGSKLELYDGNHNGFLTERGVKQIKRLLS